MNLILLAKQVLQFCMAAIERLRGQNIIRHFPYNFNIWWHKCTCRELHSSNTLVTWLANIIVNAMGGKMQFKLI